MTNKTQPLVSVVIPVWQPDEVHWRECLASVLAQTYSPLEVIVADNDPAHGVAKRVTDEMSDARLHYLPNTKRTGIFRNLNFALEQCSGEFIQIFCHDDRMLPGLLEAQVKGLELCPKAAFIYSQCHAIDDTGKIVQPCESPLHPYRYFDPEKARMGMFIFGCLPGNLSAVMIRRSLLELMGFFDEDLQYASDFHYWARATQYGGMAVSMEPLFEVRRHSSQASRVLGADLWMKESAPIYSLLYEQLPKHLKTRRTRMYANEHFGRQALTAVIRQALTGNGFAGLKNLHYLNKPPFSLFWIVVMTLLSLRNLVSWFKLPEVDFYKISEIPQQADPVAAAEVTEPNNSL
jgi:glycosyltransferase involved in cell wall biosynthesis